MSGGKKMRESKKTNKAGMPEDRMTPIIVWEKAKVEEGRDGAMGNLVPFRGGGATAEVESEAVVTERTIRVGEHRLPVKITLVTSGFGEMKACLGNGALCKAA
jgi:hypothetical protein